MIAEYAYIYCSCVFLSVVDHALTVEDLEDKVCRYSTSQYHKVRSNLAVLG